MVRSVLITQDLCNRDTSGYSPFARCGVGSSQQGGGDVSVGSKIRRWGLLATGMLGLVWVLALVGPTGPDFAGAAGPSTAIKCGPTNPLKVGIAEDNTPYASFWAAVGLPNISQGQPTGATDKQEKNILVNYINSHGGLAGCPVEGIYFPASLAGNYSQQNQAECTFFAENHVFFVAAGSEEGYDFVGCLAKHNIATIGRGNTLFANDAGFNKYSPYLYYPSDVSLSRLTRIPLLLKQAGYFNPGSKVGLVIYDAGGGAALGQSWIKSMKSMGIDVAATFSAPIAEAFSDEGAVFSEMSAAVLKFKAAGVDHVMFTPSGAWLTFPWGTDAVAQHYFPRLGLTDSDLAITYLDPPSIFPGATGIAWTYAPIGAANTNPVNASEKICQAVYPELYSLYYRLCDDFLFVQSALKKAGAHGQVSINLLHQGVTHLGNSFVSANAQDGGKTYFGPGRYDGPLLERPVQYSATSKGFVFIGPAKPLG